MSENEKIVEILRESFSPAAEQLPPDVEPVTVYNVQSAVDEDDSE